MVRCGGGGRGKGKRGSVAEAELVDANAALHVVEAARMAVDAPTIIIVKGRPANDEVNARGAFWGKAVAKVRRASWSA